MMAVYNQHLLHSGTPILRFKESRWQHTPMADTPRSNASSTYDLEDSFLAQGRPGPGGYTMLGLSGQRICVHHSVFIAGTRQ